MRILLSTYGSRGDIEPVAALAVALQKRGLEVRVSAPPDQEFVDLLTRAGVPYSPAFMGVRQWIAEAARAPKTLSELAAIMVPAEYAALEAAAEGCDAVVSTGLFPSPAAASIVAEARGLPYRFVVLCPLSLPSDHHPPFPRPGRPLPPSVTDNRTLWDFDTDSMNALFGDAVNARRTAVGLAPVASVRDSVFTDRPLLAVDPVLWPWEPTDLSHPVQTGAWLLRDSRPLPEDLEAFLAAGAPPVYVGFGSIALPSTRAAAELAVEAIRARGGRYVLARGWADAAPLDDHDDGLVIGEISQQALFPRVAAVIHHGGAGTTTTAARAGTPQLIVPQIVDQPWWAARVAALGIGAAHDGPTPTPASLAAALDIALSPLARVRAAEVAPRIAADGTDVAAGRLLESFARDRHP